MPPGEGACCPARWVDATVAQARSVVPGLATHVGRPGISDARRRDEERVAQLVRRLSRPAAHRIQDRAYHLRRVYGVALQAGMAVAIAWAGALWLTGAPSPVFAPTAAVATIASSTGRRLRRSIELIVGIVLGIAVGNAFVEAVGAGFWQMGAIVTLAILAAVSVGGSVPVVNQAASTAVLLVAVTPQGRNIEVSRIMEALIGGGAALLVTSVLLPLNPLRLINRSAAPAFDEVSKQLCATAKALLDRNAKEADQALTAMRAGQRHLALFGDAIDGAKEAITLSPVQRRRRDTVTHYIAAGDPVNRAFTNSSALIRRAVTLIEDDEPVPPGMVDAVQELGASFRLLLREFSVGRSEPQQAREQVLRAVASAGRAYATGLGLSGSVVIAQVRTTASEVIRATGLSQEQANELIREAFGDRRQDRPHPRVPRVPLPQPEKPGPDPGSAPRGNRPRRDDGPEPQEHGGRPVG